MAKQVINNGAFDNDPNADSVRVGISKANANFTELYAASLVAGTNVTLSGQLPGPVTINATGGGGGSGGLVNIQRFMAAGSFTYTPTVGTTKVIIQLWGGGGGGAGVGAPGSLSIWGIAGGAGAFLQKFLTTGFSGKTIVVGSGGAGGAAGSNNGSAGGDTTFDAAGANYISHGGSGGSFQGPTNIANVSPTVAPTTAANGDINKSGDPGGNSFLITQGNGVSAQGGSTSIGTGGPAVIINASNSSFFANPGNNASGNGAGGSSAAQCSPSQLTLAGGSGAPGACIIYEYA